MDTQRFPHPKIAIPQLPGRLWLNTPPEIRTSSAFVDSRPHVHLIINTAFAQPLPTSRQNRISSRRSLRRDTISHNVAILTHLLYVIILRYIASADIVHATY